MRDGFDYYSKIKPADLCKIKNRLKDAIAEQRLTAKEREEALAAIPSEARKVFTVENAPFVEDSNKLQDQFWCDCRQELGYPKLLDEKGIDLVESWARDNGHSSGFSAVYDCLERITEFLSEIRGHFIK